MKYSFGLLSSILFLTLSPLALAETQVYFSPNAGSQEAVVKEINKAEKSIDVAMYAITSREIAQALLKAKARGLKVKVDLDKSQITERYSKSRYLIAKGVDVKFHLGPGLMHDKFAVLDGHVVITGSFNWTAAADKKNMENLLIITDKGLAQKFAKEFKHLWAQSGQGEINVKATSSSKDAE